MKGIEIPCQQIVEWVTDYLERALSDEVRRQVDEHLAGCEPCRRYLEQVRYTMSVLGVVSDETLSPDAWATFRDTFRSLPAEPRGSR